MTPQAKMARKLQRKAEDLENENYHGEAGVFYDLAERVGRGEFTTFEPVTQSEIFDGEKILKFLLDQEWA